MDRKITNYVPFQTPIARLKSIQRQSIMKRYKKLEDFQISIFDLRDMIERLIRDVRIEYPSNINNRKIAFFFYIAKIKNFLKSESFLPDLTMLTFLESLSRSAKNGNKFVIIVENEFFDPNVLNISYNTYSQSMRWIDLFREFDFFKNLEFISMAELNEDIEDFEIVFEETKSEISVNRDDEVYRVLRDSVSFKSLDHALKYYSKENTLTRVDKIYINYMSFIEARAKVDYWNRLISKYKWVRATVSKKQGIVYIEPTVFNIPAAHSIFNARVLRDSYLIDELYYKKINYRVKVDNNVMYYF
ncbi:MAG: hypothetical protein QXH89_00790 [Candidatus Anstonellales archaeon]